MSRWGIVVIGRNEGPRLSACLRAALARGAPVVYVDSGSADGSPGLAASLGVDLVELDAARPFTAARARNVGFAAITARLPGLPFVQFVDGDCELAPEWLERGAAAMEARPEVAAVCGRIEERSPEASLYNRLCALEWQKTPGEIPACGGNFLVRASAFLAAGGFREDVTAAEDDELCLRLRRQGGKVLHLDADMVRHDAAMSRFRQWWDRARRMGRAYAQGAELHGRSPDRHFVADCRRLWLWGLALPLLALVPAWLTGGWSLLLLAAYPAQVLRIQRRGRGRGWSGREAWLYALFTVLAKFPGLQGLLEYRWLRLRGRPSTLVEHKGGAAP